MSDALTASASVRALGDLKVLDLAWVVAGPAVGRVLADFGATVVRVESRSRVETARLMGPFPQGKLDPERSALYDTCNAGKLGVLLDLKLEAGREVVRALARWADVLIESFSPGQMARWGLSASDLQARNPGLIYLSTSLMGQSGPLHAFAGYGNMGAALAGYQGLAGHEGVLPIGPYGPYTDFVGPRFALMAVLAALERRRQTGLGCTLDVSQVEAGIQFLGGAIADAAATGSQPVPHGNRDAHFAPHGLFMCGDDAYVAIVARDNVEWARLAGLIGGDAGDARFVTLAGRKAHEMALERIMEDWTSRYAAIDVERQVQALRVPAHQVSASADVMADAQLAERGHFVWLEHALGGRSVIDASRMRLSATPAGYDRPAPHFGRDTDRVLQDILGYDAPRIEALREVGALK